jgi:EAL domain-containing protein (putative c-di-GMP-specific phosphodiesterase class I)
MAQSLGLNTIAEGVETRAQYDLLRTLGCQQIQGYLISRPVPEEEILKMLLRS